ncbi:mitochondrial carrier protein [Indivirus ILV1]|uniref:Mitochondrial carrier protein n=1 Tax=Indivirus ILV1 TaxID=1977633 RepID=A0A1V0SDD6_9VIRU|nr:mitochondrial carrier protein [Indivirus ILV1]
MTEETKYSFRSFLNGAFGGTVGITISHPFDTIKTCIQDNKPVKLGIRSLYNGFLPPLIGVGFEKAIVFGVYTNTYTYIEKYSNNTILNNTISGGLSGLMASLIVTPVERIKILLQTNQKVNINQLTPKYLFKGLSATFTRETPGFAIYFNIYEGFKKYFYTNKNQEIPVFSSFIFGGLSGSAAWIFIYPQDCIKTRMQANINCTKSFSQVVKEIYNDGGFKIFYRGFHYALMRAIPLHAGTFMTFEYLKKI